MKNPSAVQTEGLGSYPHCNGFTLLEVMVALVLLAVIMTTSVTLLFVNLKGWEGLTEHSDEIQQAHLIEKRVASLIEHLAPLVWRDQKQRQLALDGESQRFQFVSKAPQQYRAGGLFEYLLVQEVTDDLGLSLVLYFAPFDPNATHLTLPDNASRRVLLSDLQGVEFSYFGSKHNRETRVWRNDWGAASIRYPELIRLSLRYSTEKKRVRERYIRIHQDHPIVVQRQ
jgi:prepilin-type N-terminal cleavage/methylation domain-containing protein